MVKVTWNFFCHPIQTSRELAAESNLRPSLSLVVGFACLLGLAYLISYLAKAYPPPPADWQVWIDTWGATFMKPIIPVPLESYRLFLAIAIIPWVIGLWLAMAGLGTLFSRLFGGKVGFKGYLSVFGLSFFPFWILAAILDFLYMGFINPYIVPALNMEYGLLPRTVVYLVPLVMYPTLMGIGGVYNAVATRAIEGFAGWKAAITGTVTCVMAIVLLSVVVR